MKNSIVILLSLSLFTLALGCKKNKNESANTARVMFVNGCAGTLPGIDAKIDDVVVSGAENIAFGNNSGYRTVISGIGLNISYFVTNSGTPVTNKTINMTNGGHYSAFCGGLITAPTFIFTDDNISTPVSNTAKVRFINLSNDNLRVTANAGNLVIDSAITSLKVSQYLQVTAGSYEIKAGDPADISTIVTTEPKSQTLGAGKVYTVMLTGTKAGTGASALKLTIMGNN